MQKRRSKQECKRRSSNEDFHAKIVRVIYGTDNDQSYYSMRDLANTLCNDKTRNNTALLKEIAKRYGIKDADTMTKRMLCREIRNAQPWFGISSQSLMYYPKYVVSWGQTRAVNDLRVKIGAKLRHDFVYTAIHSHEKDQFDIRRDSVTKAKWCANDELTGARASESIFVEEIDEMYDMMKDKGKRFKFRHGRQLGRFGTLNKKDMHILSEMRDLVTEICKRVDAYNERIHGDKSVKEALQQERAQQERAQ